MHPMQRIYSLLLVIFFSSFSLLAQDVVRVTGKVTSKTKGAPLFGVNIVDNETKRIMAQTDEDGRFAINVHDNTSLTFSMIGAKSLTEKLKRRTYVEIQMEEEDVFLNVADVVAKRIVDKVQPEQTDIEIRGNYFYVKTRVRVPREMFSRDTRLVVQPFLNNVTTGELRAMRPMVYDAKTYHTTQNRMYDYRMDEAEGDPLAQYVVIKADSLREKGKRSDGKERTNDIIGYTDSIYVENVRQEYSCDVYMAIENYNRILYRDTTVIARGTVNPLRWLDYSFASSVVTDSTLFPKEEMQLRDAKGSVDLRYPIGKDRFDPSDPLNAEEVRKMQRQMLEIQSNPDCTLRTLEMEGVASPDGHYNRNLELAQRRMDFALEYIKSQVPVEMRRNMKFSSKAKVAAWEEVASLLRADSLNAEAARVEEVVRLYKHIDRQGVAMRKLPFYKTLLQETYLPRLRTVGYTMNYSVFRQLTLEEIRELYAKDYRQLSRYEYFRLYREEVDVAKREKILRQALEIYPSFMVAANDLQALLITDRRPDAELLRPFVGEKAPAVVNANHMIAQISSDNYSSADSVAAFIPETKDTRLLLAVNGVLNGRYEANYETISQTGLRNEVVMMLAMKRNKAALDLSERLPENEALTFYLRAICLNRAERPLEAYEALKRAFKMDPALEKTAVIDGDVNDLLLDKKK